MTTIIEYFKQSELALAAYSALSAGIAGDPYIGALEKAGMSSPQAENFATDWRVIDQFTDPTGVSATIFEKGGQRYLAVRGTELSLGDILADGVLALGVPEKLNQQYIALKAQMEKWCGEKDGVKGPLKGISYTASGHSLGGYLAAALKRTYPDITAAYLYNAPGTGGLIGNLADLISSIFTDSVPGADGIWNIKGSEGASFITGLGSQASPGIPIQIEQDTNIGFGNHSVVRLTDALAIHALYARIFPDLSASNRNVLFDASGAVTEETLEAALDALRKLVLGPDIATTLDDEFPAGKPETRDRFFTYLYELQKSQKLNDLGSLSATLLTGKDAARLTEMAYANTPEGQAVRYAMENLNPFFVTGASYAEHNAQGELDLFDPQTGQGTQTLEYLKDRAALLERKMWFSLQEKNPVNPQMQSGSHLFENEVAYYEDIGNRYKIAQGTINDATPRFLFGSGKTDAFEGIFYGSAANEAERFVTGKGSYVVYGDGPESGRATTSSGIDLVDAGDGRDMVFGGGGDDRIEGGTDGDILGNGYGMKFRTILSAAMAVAVIGCATPSQISADTEVDRLCAVDGGVKVYETVTLPADKFDTYGNFRVPSKQDTKASDNYYYEWIVSKIKGGNPHYDGTLVIEKSHFKYWRSRDGKLLGEQISYSRIGGDVPGPWHPSSYTCPGAHNTLSVDKQIFRNEVNK